MHIDAQVLIVALLASGLLGFNIALAWADWNRKREQRRIEEANIDRFLEEADTGWGD